MDSKAGRPSRRRLDLSEPTPIPDEVPARLRPGWTRPAGYLVMSLVWLVILTLAVFALLVAPPAMLDAITDGRGLRFAPLYERADAIPTTIGVIVVAGPVCGVVTLSVLAAATGIALSSMTLFVRSLLPRYADEQLSFSIRSRSETIGSPATAITGTTVSLIPLRMTRWSKVLTIIRFNGFLPNVNSLLLGTIFGIGYLWTIGWAVWRTSGATLALCATSSAVILAVLVGLGIGRRNHYAGVMLTRLERTAYARSWPNPASRPRKRRSRAR